MTFFFFLSIACFSLLGFYSGWKAHSQLNTDYRERWHQANRLLQADPTSLQSEVTQLTQAKAELEGMVDQFKALDKQSEADEIRQLLSCPPGVRAQMEWDRLKEGFPPIDPMTNLPPGVYREMKRTRLKEGYDA